MKDRNYFCKVIVKNLSELSLFLHEYEKIDSAYHGNVSIPNFGRAGFYYLASHPVTKEIILRYDIAETPCNKKDLKKLKIDWDEIQYFKEC